MITRGGAVLREREPGLACRRRGTGIEKERIPGDPAGRPTGATNGVPRVAAVGRLDETIGLVQAAHEVRRVVRIDLYRIEVSHLTAADETERRAAVGRFVDRPVAFAAVDPEGRRRRSGHGDRATDRAPGDRAVDARPGASVVARLPHFDRCPRRCRDRSGGKGPGRSRQDRTRSASARERPGSCWRE